MEEIGKKIDAMSNELTDTRYSLWTQYTLFTWQWWMLAVLCVVFLTAFVVLLARGNALKMLAFYGIIYVINRNLDDLATAKDWYDYRMQLEPIIPTMLPANLFVIPMAMSMIYQLFQGWRSFLVASSLFSAASAYGALPFMKQVGIYLPKLWDSSYSFVSLVLMALLTKAIVDWAVRWSEGRSVRVM